MLNFKYPLELGDTVDDCRIEQLSKLCFPFTDTAAIATKSHFFTFTFTRGDGSLRYGFCLQLEPSTPASDAVLHCIITGLPWFTFFHDVLKVLAALNSSSKVWLHQMLAYPAFTRSNRPTSSSGSSSTAC